MSDSERLSGLLERARSDERRAELEGQLALPPFPDALAYIWSAFSRLRNRKGGTGFGPSPIEWPDIDAFCRHSRMTLAPWEVEVIEALDGAYLRVGTKKAGG